MVVYTPENPGTMRAVYVAPDGVEWPLTGPHTLHGWLTPPGPAGWGAAPISIVSDPRATGGDQVRHIRSSARRINWPLHVYGDTHEQFVTRWRALIAAITMTTHRMAAGALRVERPDGSARQIDVFYEDGLQGAAGEAWLSANPVVTWYCPDGYWRDTTPMTVERSHSPGASFLGDYPRISSSRVLGTTDVVNPGEVTAWPTWTLTGPATSLTAVNHTLGQQFALSHSLGAGETVTVTTFPPTVRGPGDVNLVDSLDWPDSQLWPLAPGVNSVEFLVGGATTGSMVEMAFYPRYEAA